MKAVFLRAGAILLAASLAGCATTDTGGAGGRSGMEVTRYHLGNPIARGQIAIEAADPRDTATPEFGVYSGIVGRQLAQLGWTVVNAVPNSEQVAIVGVSRGSRETYKRPPVTIGIGGGTGGWHSGVGGGASFGVGGGAREVVGTLLDVRIKRRSDGTVFWQGQASIEVPAASADAQPAVTVEKLAAALFRDFPGESGRTIRLR
jgi:hypothetical protein